MDVTARMLRKLPVAHSTTSDGLQGWNEAIGMLLNGQPSSPGSFSWARQHQRAQVVLGDSHARGSSMAGGSGRPGVARKPMNDHA
jgi:hypothetical protein